MQDESDQEAVGGIKMSKWISVSDRLPEPPKEDAGKLAERRKDGE